MNEERPIATYREQRLDGKRIFELFDDRVRIFGSAQFSSEFELSAPLATLRPRPNRFKVRHRAFWCGLWLLLGFCVLDIVLVSALRVPGESFAVIIVGCMAMSGLVIMLATARRVEFASFSTVAGVQALDIARAGPDTAHFDPFVQSVSAAITRASSGVA